MANSLTAAERETVCRWSDADEYVTIWSAQRPVITKLRANPAAREIENGYHGTSAWAIFELPAGLITFRNGRRTLSEEERATRAERLRAARRAKEIAADIDVLSRAALTPAPEAS